MTMDSGLNDDMGLRTNNDWFHELQIYNKYNHINNEKYILTAHYIRGTTQHHQQMNTKI